MKQHGSKLSLSIENDLKFQRGHETLVWDLSASLTVMWGLGSRWLTVPTDV
jgi:hypothetical protein